MQISVSTFILILFIHITTSQRSYDEATCNGDTLFSFANNAARLGEVDMITNPTSDTPTIDIIDSFIITNPPSGASSNLPEFQSTAIDPTTDTIYTIIKVPGIASTTYLATVDIISKEVTIINEITPTNDVITGMTVDCVGNLYVIEFEQTAFGEYGLFLMDKTSGEHEQVGTFSGNCLSPGFGNCNELIGYNWDDGLLYRISSGGDNENIILYKMNSTGGITTVTVSDPNEYCSLGVYAMEYIGDDLWLISCVDDFGSTRLLDTLDISNPVIGPIGTDGILFDDPSQIDRSGSGLIGSTEGGLCVAVCPNITTTIALTTDTPTTDTPTTDTPTTDAPTTTGAACPECPFGVELDEISPLLITSDCPTTTQPATTARSRWAGESDSSNGDSSSDRRRRRMLDVYSDSDDSDDSDDLCLITGDPLVFVDSLCVDDGYHEPCSDSDSDSDDSDDEDILTDAFLAPICVTYTIEDLAADITSDCGEINSIFLGLCTSTDTDFDVSLLGTGDIDNILDIDGSENILTAIGYRNDDDELGVQIVVQDPSVSFTLCFTDVAVTATFNDTRYDLDIATNGAIEYTDTDGDVVTCTAIGLPCLNFFFGCEDDLIGPETATSSITYGFAVEMITNRDCDCDEGLTVLQLMYDGSDTASSIVGYNNRNGIICSFDNVEKGESIFCTAENTNNGKFGRNMIFTVNDGECTGKVATNCRRKIVDKTLRGCDDLTVISYIDVDGAYCDADVLASDTDGFANVFINQNEAVYTNPLKVLDELDPYIRWTLICVLITFVMLICISMYICIIHKHEKSTKTEEKNAPKPITEANHVPKSIKEERFNVEAVIIALEKVKTSDNNEY